MPQPQVKKRNATGAGTSTTMEPPSTTSTSKRGPTLTWHEAAEWQRDSKYILSGYRREKADYLEILTSLTFLHNETCNVYTHLIGAVLLPLIATTILRGLSQSQFSVVSGTDYTMFGIFFWSAEFCLLFSTAFHLLGAHSREVEHFWHRMDLLGIVIVIISGSSTAALICIPVFSTLRWRKLYGLEYMTQYSGMNWYLLELAIYGSGTTLYALRIPERFAPGKFDIWCSSHQIFHVCILCAMYIHTFGLMQAFTACHTLDICKIQAAHKAGQRS
ncbi:mPR-like GPCR protein [Cordyceps fumosorosea ARSEF 2679]|uniref:MPR-like GPCR protein n=1 Tax=Cordyceps fumosorosea (strain ARSEF 2679) TaxID=1081104 RepID=A0A167N5W4_CORFA|nr:mPR-like GPCR protein [Cordyceps fumosorosea ARSEF 2679]OAA55164.1 mPR-like GPCR protein [Cordyceps fumosorosea ARSEF 2679]